MGLFGLLRVTTNAEDFQEHPTQASEQLHPIFFFPAWQQCEIS